MTVILAADLRTCGCKSYEVYIYCTEQRVHEGVGCGGVCGGGGLLRSWLVGGSFLVISAGDTMKVTRQKDLIAPF